VAAAVLALGRRALTRIDAREADAGDEAAAILIGDAS